MMSAVAKPGLGQRLGALALLLLLVIGAFYLLVDQILIARYHFYQDHQEQGQGRLEQLQRMAASREPVQGLITKIQQDRNVSAQYLSQSAPPLAAADLQQRVKAAVDAAGGTLRSTQSLPPVEEGNTVKVTVNATVTGDIDSLRKILHTLESQTPLLFIDNLEVSAREIRQRLPNGRMSDDTRIQLSIQFEVSGYLRKEKA